MKRLEYIHPKVLILSILPEQVLSVSNFENPIDGGEWSWDSENDFDK